VEDVLGTADVGRFGTGSSLLAMKMVFDLPLALEVVLESVAVVDCDHVLIVINARVFFPSALFKDENGSGEVATAVAVAGVLGPSELTVVSDHTLITSVRSGGGDGFARGGEGRGFNPGGFVPSRFEETADRADVDRPGIVGSAKVTSRLAAAVGLFLPSRVAMVEASDRSRAIAEGGILGTGFRTTGTCTEGARGSLTTITENGFLSLGDSPDFSGEL